MSKLIYSPNSIASYPIYSATFPNCVLAEIKLHPIENTLSHFQVVSAEIRLQPIENFLGQIPFVSQPKFNCIWSNFFQDGSKLLSRWNSIAFSRKVFETFQMVVLAKIRLHPLEKFLTHLQKVLHPKLNCIWLNLFQDTFKLCLIWKSIANYRKYPKKFEIVTEPIFNCILSNMFSQILILRLSQKSIASHRIYSKSFQNFV